MISFLEGLVEYATPLQVVLNCNGVGYRVEIPVTTAEKIPALGQSVRLHIQAVYREDSQALYGFISPEERDFFHLLTTKVNGIGPKIGLNLLSRLSFPMLLGAIARADAALLAKCPGIGKKTAERICIELGDKLGATSSLHSTPISPDTSPPVRTASSTQNHAFSDAIQALITLGYKMDAADQAVRKAHSADPDASADQLIRAALKS
jgi:Holliday junction DNA helicase RuvA